MDFDEQIFEPVGCSGDRGEGDKGFSFPCESLSMDDDELTESKIKAFLDEKVLFQLKSQN